MSIVMLFKVISDTAICYAFFYLVYIVLFFFFRNFMSFFSLCMFTGGLLLEDFKSLVAS